MGRLRLRGDVWEPAENIAASAPDAVVRYDAAKKLWEARYGERYQPPDWWYRESDAERMFA